VKEKAGLGTGVAPVTVGFVVSFETGAPVWALTPANRRQELIKAIIFFMLFFLVFLTLSLIHDPKKKQKK
jgi:hypothetical protein